MLAVDIRLLHQRLRTLLLPEIAVLRVLTFSCTGSLGPNSHRATWKGLVDRYIHSEFHYKRGTLKVGKLNYNGQ